MNEMNQFKIAVHEATLRMLNEALGNCRAVLQHPERCSPTEWTRIQILAAKNIGRKAEILAMEMFEQGDYSAMGLPRSGEDKPS